MTVTVANTQEVVRELVSHDRWDKIHRLIAELTIMDLEDSEGLHRARMESIIWLLVYVDRTYRDMNPYLKGLCLTLDIWMRFREEEG